MVKVKRPQPKGEREVITNEKKKTQEELRRSKRFKI